MIPLEEGRHMQPTAPSDPSGGADSGVLFGATILVIVGVFQVLQGLSAIVGDGIIEEPTDYTYALDVSTWGWVHLGLGLLLALTGIFLFRGSRTAGITAIVMIGLSAIANFLFIPHYPFWGLIILFLEIWVVWAIFASGVLERRPLRS